MIFKTTTIMACILVGDMNLSNTASSVAQALTVNVPIDWQLEALVDGAHLKEPKAIRTSSAYQGREIVFKMEAAEPDFRESNTRDENEASYHIAEFITPNGGDYVLTAWRKLEAGGWLVLRAFTQSNDGEQPAFADAWTIFDSVSTA